jgi:hypothetical protein
VVGLVGGGLFVWLGDGGESPEERRPTPDEDAPAKPPRVAWARAANRLERAGSFTYRGTVRTHEPNAVRPGTWLATEVTVEGAVVAGSISREVATDRRGHAVETVTSGPFAWSRMRPPTGGFEAAAWRIARAPDPLPSPRVVTLRPIRLGPPLVVDAIRLAGNRRSDPPPPGGTELRTLRGTAQVDDRDNPGVDDLLDRAEIVLWVDEHDNPTRVRLTTTPADDPRLVVDLTLDHLGEPDLIAPADVADPIRQTLPVDVLEAADVQPVELGRIPSGWGLVWAEVWRGCSGERCGTQYGQTCPGLELWYSRMAPSDDPGALGGGMSLSVTSEACRREGTTFRWEDPIRAGAFSGTVNDSAEITQGSVSDGVTAVDFTTDLPAEDATELLESLVPFDPDRRP